MEPIQRIIFTWKISNYRLNEKVNYLLRSIKLLVFLKICLLRSIRYDLYVNYFCLKKIIRVIYINKSVEIKIL